MKKRPHAEAQRRGGREEKKKKGMSLIPLSLRLRVSA
jgi:hypothetical protein